MTPRFKALLSVCYNQQCSVSSLPDQQPSVYHKFCATLSVSHLSAEDYILHHPFSWMITHPDTTYCHQLMRLRRDQPRMHICEIAIYVLDYAVLIDMRKLEHV